MEMGVEDSQDHPLLQTLQALRLILDQDEPGAGAGLSGLSQAQVQQVAVEAWQVIQQIQGRLLLPAVAEAEAEKQRLFRHPDYASASSTKDLVAGWLRCPPVVAGRLVKTAKHCLNGSFTATGEALAAGQIDTDHVRAVVDAVRRLPVGVVDRDQRVLAESTMLDTAKATDAEVTETAGRRLLELVAPDAAVEYADRQAERDRQRAESSRWLEITGFGIAGAKELRLRAESGVIDTFARLIASVMQSSPADSMVSGPRATDTTQRYAESIEQVGTIGPDGTTLPSVECIVRAERAAPAGPLESDRPVLPAGGAPGAVADAGLILTPLERRRADAAVEVIDGFARPDLRDTLSPVELRRLADQLDATTGGVIDRTGVAIDGSEVGDSSGVGDGSGVGDETLVDLDVSGQFQIEDCHDDRPADRDSGHRSAVVVPSQRGPEPTDTAGRHSPVRSTANPRTARQVRAERLSLVVLADYDHVRQQLRAGLASSAGAPTRTVSPTEVERLACEANTTPVWMTRGIRPVAVASTSRYFRGKQLTALIARDRGCCFPGCSRELRYAHSHHIIPVSQGGTTTVDNGTLLCGTHHRVIHTPGGWTIRLGSDGLPEFIPPYWIDATRTPQRHTRHQIALPSAA